MECEQLSNHKENHCNYNGEIVKNTRTISKHSNLFNHINNLAPNHNVRASSTMIKVTYNKGTKSPALQSFESKKDHSRINHCETVIALNASKLPKKKSLFDNKNNFGMADKLKQSKVLLKKGDSFPDKADIDFLMENNHQLIINQKKNQNGCREMNSAKHRKQIKFHETEHSKSVQLNHGNALKSTPSIDPLIDSSECCSNSQRRLEIGAGLGGGDSNFNENAPKNLDNSTDEDEISQRRGNEKNKLKCTPNSVVGSKIGDSTQAGASESESETSGGDSDSEMEIERDSIVNSTKKIQKKRKLDNAAEERENKKSAKKMRKSLLDDEKEILFDDEDLPPGWQRFIHTRKGGMSDGQNDVHILSPNGKIFRFRGALKKYLEEEKLPYSIDHFYFGLYKRKSDAKNDSPIRKNNDSQKRDKRKSDSELLKSKKLTKGTNKDKAPKDLPPSKICKSEGVGSSKRSENDENAASRVNSDFEKNLLSGGSPISGENGKLDYDRIKPRYRYSHPPMRVDPDLPEGWHRSIKVRSTGESAGRMEVIINSPDGRKHRNKGALDQYLKQNKLPFKVDDFDFTLFGKNFKKLNGEVKQSSESLMIGNVSGTMVACGVTTVRNERRLRTSKVEREKASNYNLESSDFTTPEENASDIPEKWILDLARCRSEFGSLQQNAASAIASATKDFLQGLALQALKGSKCPEKGLEYDDVASLVQKSECLSSLRPLIPKKITFKEFIKLNRPKKFSSFT